MDDVKVTKFVRFLQETCQYIKNNLNHLTKDIVGSDWSEEDFDYFMDITREFIEDIDDFISAYKNLRAEAMRKMNDVTEIDWRDKESIGEDFYAL